MTWQQRPFPDANLLLLPGRDPTLVDSGFVGHAGQTADWVHARTGQLSLVVNTHWHADHVGGNAILRARGAGIAASIPDADAVARRDPGYCQAEYKRTSTSRAAARRRSGAMVGSVPPSSMLSISSAVMSARPARSATLRPSARRWS